MESFCVSLAAMILTIKKKNFNITNMPDKTFYETIFNGVIFGSFFGIAYFTVDALVKLANDQKELIREMHSQLEELEDFGEKQCEEKLSQCKKALN